MIVKYLYKKNIVSKSNGKFDSVTDHGHLTIGYAYVIYYDVCYRTFFKFILFPWSCCCFSAKQAAVRRKSKDWLARNQNNESEWSDMSIHVLSFQ
jgi:predicted LPLAT superfamily acyltransferase